MKIVVCVALALAACGDSKLRAIDAVVPLSDGFFTPECICNPLQQTGCPGADYKCTWTQSAPDPTIGAIACAPSGSAAVGESCEYATAYRLPFDCGDHIADNCVKGAVCVAGVCERVCDNEGGAPMCGSADACVTIPGLFSTGSQSPAAAGICMPQ